MIPGIVAGRPKPSHWLPFTPYINLPFEGPNGSTTFTDTTGRTWAGNGNAQISTAQSAVGFSSLLLDGTGDYIQTASASAIQMSGDFRMRCYIRAAAIGPSTKCIASKRPASSASEFAWDVIPTGELRFTAWGAAGATAVSMTSPSPISTLTWHKVEIHRAGTGWQMLIDDAVVASQTQSMPPVSNTELFLIGRDRTNTGRDWNGYIDEFVFERPT